MGAGDASPPAEPVADGGPLTVGAIVTVAGVLFLFVVFAVGLVSLQYCINYLDRRRRRAQESPSGRPRRRAAGAVVGRGVDPELLRSLPVTVYRASSSGPKDNAVVECAVCLAELEDGEAARFLPRCGHGFHAECVDMWLASHTTCPLCRLIVAKPDIALVLPPVAPEPANYGSSSLPASVLLGVPGHHQGAASAANPSPDCRVPTTAMLVIEIPESAAPTPRDVAKSPGLARLMSFRSLWSFGRQGAGPSTSCSCERADLEQGTGIAVAEAQLPSEAYTAGGTRRAGT
ncbi:hypothetical protein EJB05_21222, partial [Eragrostis curvula]